MDGLFKASIPEFLRQLSMRYMIIGGRAYNLLLNNPVPTHDYDVKLDLLSEEQLPTVRNQLLKFLQQRHPDLELVPEDKPGVIRIVWHTDVGTVDVVDFSTVGPEHRKPGKYELTFDDRISAPNGLYYGNLRYLLLRLEELAQDRYQDYLTVVKGQESTQNIVPVTQEIMEAVALDDRLVAEDAKIPTQAQRVVDIVSHMGESEEVDSTNVVEFKDIMDFLVNTIIDMYGLDDDDGLNEFMEYDQDEANQYMKSHPLNTSIPRDMVIALYQLESLVNLSFVNYIDVNEKKNKYLRTLERLESFYRGIHNPYQHFSKFFLRLLEEQCVGVEAVDLFVRQKFECRLLHQ